MIDIRPITPADLPLVETVFGLGVTGKHAERLDRQKNGAVVYLIAWDRERPIGHALLNWAGSGDDHVRRRLNVRCPDLEDLFVCPDLRGTGIGSQILYEAEQRTMQQGYHYIGLSVDAESNPGARRLYERSGYRDAGFGAYIERGEYVDRHGLRQTWEEMCVYLLKELKGDS